MSAFSTRTLSVNGQFLQIIEQGEGPLVLLCHGFPETAYAWRHQIGTLAAAGFRAVAPDMRGVGGSSGPEGADQYTILHLLGDMVALLDALVVETAVIVGNDWGSSLAWQAALLRPDRFRAVAAIGVPFTSQAPAPPTKIFPQTDEALFYTLYFQPEGAAEAEFERDTRLTLRKILFAASAEAGPRQPGDGTPNPFAMVSRTQGLLAPLPDPDQLPHWLSEVDLDAFAAAFGQSGFRGGLNLYRNLDRNWEQQAAFAGMKVDVPALYMVGDRDVGLAIPGMRELIAGMTDDVPRLRQTVYIPECGHWAPQEKPEQVSENLIAFLREL
jgi:pimeloyl-ACP methyl ester carboxylesterase